MVVLSEVLSLYEEVMADGKLKIETE